MNSKDKVIPERYVKDILLAIETCIPILEQGLDKIEEDIRLQRSSEISEEVKSFMKVMGYPNITRLDELKEKRERLLTIHQFLSQ